MTTLRYLAGMFFLAIALSACNKDTYEIGSSLTLDADRLQAVSAQYPVTTRTIQADSVLTRSNACYLGRVVDTETGAYLGSSFMTQFHILETFWLTDEDSIVSRYDGRAAADSCVLTLYLSPASRSCDRSAAVRLHVAELSTPMEETAEYYSNYDPVAHGHISLGGFSKDKMCTFDDQTDTDSLRSNDEASCILIPLNEPYTDRQGRSYKNYGTYIMQQYYDHPGHFKNAYHFIHNVCPGFYFNITDGYGFHALVTDVSIRIFYRALFNDSIVSSAITLAGTDEVLQTTYIDNDEAKLTELASDATCTYLKAPAGLYTEVTLPVEQIIQSHERDTILGARLAFQRINSTVGGDSAPTIPQNLLLLPKDSLHSFFAKRKVFDAVTAFQGQYSSAYNVYAFNNVATLITAMENRRREGLRTDPHWTDHHPDWNKALLVPVTVTSTAANSYSAAVITDVSPCMDIQTTRLVGGSQNPYDPIKLTVVYAKFDE